MSCGTQLEAGARFCQRCGTAVATAAAPAPPQVCGNCGAVLQPGRRFCTSCGTSVDGTEAPGRAAAPASDSVQVRVPTGLLVGGVAAVVAIAVLAFLVFGGGDDDGSSAGGGTFGSGGSGGGSGSELAPDVGIAEYPEVVELDLPPGSDKLGANDDTTVDAIRTFMEDSGFTDLPLDMYVFPIRGTGESMLVLDADLDALTAYEAAFDESTLDTTSDDFLLQLIELPEMRAANVTRLTMNLRGSDEVGPFVMTATLPLGALDPDNPEYANLSEEEQAALIKVEVKR